MLVGGSITFTRKTSGWQIEGHMQDFGNLESVWMSIAISGREVLMGRWAWFNHRLCTGGHLLY